MSQKIAPKPDNCKQDPQARPERHKHKKVDRLTQAGRRERDLARQEEWREQWIGAGQAFLETLLDGEVAELLGRPARKWGNRAEPSEVRASCNRCGRKARGWFRRNGTYGRTWGLEGIVVTVRVPRLRCHCGGTVDLSFSVFAPYARISPEWEERLREGIALGLTLRQVGQMTAPANGGPLAKSTISVRGLEAGRLVRALRQGVLARVPPAVLVDGLWVKVLVPTGAEFVDRRGRQRPRVRRQRVGLLVAFGVDPTTSDWGVLDWERATQEDQESWGRLLERLRERGLTAERGLRLLVSDGSEGLKAALAEVDLGVGVKHQLCVFHRLRNISKAVKGLQTLGSEQTANEKEATKAARQERRREVATDAAAIYQGADRAEILRRRDAFVTKWQEEEPEAVATLQRDFERTIAYLDVQEAAAKQGMSWEAKYLRTTSRLERLNRTLRRMVRQVVLFHGEAGLDARVYLVLMQAGELQIGRGADWSAVIEDALAAA
jgi:transposase-like protein